MNTEQYTLNFELRGDYLYVLLEGKDSYSASISYWTRIAEEAKARNLTKVLVHENLEGEISEGEVFGLIIEVLPANTGIKIALFDEQNVSSEINELGELVAQNRGADIHIFQSLECAEHWLIEN
jgi:hypothetical protein